MRKPDEIALYARLRELRGPEPYAVSADSNGTKVPVWPDVAEPLGIPEKRCYYLLFKWSDKDWWNYGVNARWGWFTPNAPASLDM